MCVCVVFFNTFRMLSVLFLLLLLYVNFLFQGIATSVLEGHRAVL